MKKERVSVISVIMLLVAAILLMSSCNNSGSASPNTAVTEDRAGNSISLPDKIDKIITIGPSNTEIVSALGFGGKIIAMDEYSSDVSGVSSGIPLLNMMALDGELILSLEPDVIFITGMSLAGGDDPLAAVTNAGVCVIYIPVSSSIEGIKEDIRFIAAVMDVSEKGDEIVGSMEKEIADIKKIGDSITDKKTVYFEVSSPPYMTSFGNGVYLDEMLGIIGAVNILDGQSEWVSISDEAVLSANPDVIMTSVDYLDDPIDEIKSRTGWSGITAVKNDDVYLINANSSSRPSHNIILALWEMAKAVYPDKY